MTTFFFFVLTACGSTNQIPPPVNPDTLPADLGVSDGLPGAVDEFSVRLGIDPEDVAVRIQFRGCETCEIRQPPKQPPDLTLNEALEQLQAYDRLWLVAPNAICYYYFDGETASPLSCQLENNTEGATP